MLVVVHPHTLVPRQLRQVGDKGRLAYAGVSLSEKDAISSRSRMWISFVGCANLCSKEDKNLPEEEQGGRRETQFWIGQQDSVAPEKQPLIYSLSDWRCVLTWSVIM